MKPENQEEKEYKKMKKKFIKYCGRKMIKNKRKKTEKRKNNYR